ncbi:MAG: hypothetical protein LBM98_03720 [Oscillospiraceae bacterium]|jgi:hypothetical protein|nr:hypothetical protein [Oscillospiraceae bacterium]
MSRERSLFLAPIFRKISIVLLFITFATWFLPYFDYDASEYGIDISAGPLRYSAEDGRTVTRFYNEKEPRKDADGVPMTDAKGRPVLITNVLTTAENDAVLVNYTDRNGNPQQGYIGGKRELHDYRDKASLWGFLFLGYSYPQILAELDYTAAAPAVDNYKYVDPNPKPGQENALHPSGYHDLFYRADGSRIPYREVITDKLGAGNTAAEKAIPKFIKMWHIEPLLFMVLAGILGIVLCWKRRGITTQFWPLIVASLGIGATFANRIIGLCNDMGGAAQWIHFAMYVLLAANAIVGIVVQSWEIKTRPEEYYLPMVA